jgi:hypothetical protein
VPGVLVTLPKLQVLSLANNQLSGNLFAVGGALGALRNNKISYFDISNNQLFADLPDQLSWLALFDPARTDLVRRGGPSPPARLRAARAPELPAVSRSRAARAPL